MGVKGLMKYMTNHAKLYLELQELSDTYLVIDGCNICHLLFQESTLVSSNGSEYEKFADLTERFFDDLLKCKIQPLVILDGGWETRKLPTIMRRKRDVLAQLYHGRVPGEFQSSVKPVFLGTVFKSVLLKKNIRFAMTTFEGDTATAAVARFLDCPVLSQDSDFFIFQGSYICYPWLGNYVQRTDTGYRKFCKIFRSRKLSEVYPGLHSSLIPIFATLMGNDFTDNRCFRPLFDTFFSPPEDDNEFMRVKIEATFSWLRNRSLGEAIETILNTVQKEDRDVASQAIRSNIRMYTTNLPLELLKPLGFSDGFIEDAMIKFRIDNDEADEEFRRQGNFGSNLPSCFLQKFHEGVFPAYFMNCLVHRLTISGFQKEALQRPPPILVALDLLKIIDKVLISLLDESVVVDPLKIGMRMEGSKRLEFVTFQSVDMVSKCDSKSDSNSNWISGLESIKLIPTFLELESLDLASKRQTFNRILEIPDSFMEELPDNWKIYLAAVVYWMKKKDTLRNQLHLDTLLYCLLFNIIDEKLDFERDEAEFYKKYGKKVRSIKKEGTVLSHNGTKIGEIFNSITESDCIMATRFFLYFSKYDNKKPANLLISNVYLGFEYCLQYVDDINALFGLPYARLDVSALYKERLMYNLYDFFCGIENFESYISNTLKFSPVLFKLFETLRAKFRKLLSTFNV